MGIDGALKVKHIVVAELRQKQRLKVVRHTKADINLKKLNNLLYGSHKIGGRHGIWC